MNPWKQFWTLFKFQTTLNPAIWFMPLVLGVSLFPSLLTRSVSNAYHPGFFSLFMTQNLFFVGIFGMMIMAPEKFMFGGSNLASNYHGTEFFLTRAIDRPILYRMKVTFLYLLVLMLPFLAIASSLKDPDLIVNEYSKQVQQACLASVPGSVLLPETKKSPELLIAIPRGNVLVSEWQFWVFLITTVALQLLILLLYPFKYAKFFFWIFFFGLIFCPLFWSMREIGKSTPSLNERLFFFFAAHQVLFGFSLRWFSSPPNSGANAGLRGSNIKPFPDHP